MKTKFLLAILLIIIMQGKLQAQWQGNPAVVDNPIATSPENEAGVQCVADGAGGAIYIFGGGGVVLAQRKDATGAPVWSATSKPIQVFNQGVNLVDLEPDGKGGVYFSMQKYYSASSADVYIQYITKDGKLPFGISGIKLDRAGSNYCTDPKICATARGLIAAWSDNIPGTAGTFTYAQVFVQRYDSTGTPQWLVGGQKVSLVNSMRNVPEIVSDQHSGAFIAFSDYRNDTLNPGNNLDVYAQHLDSTGKRLWGSSDLIITNHPFNQSVYNNDYPVPAKSMIADSAGGCIIVYRSVDDDSMFCQRINAAGTLLFGSNGISMSTDYYSYHAFMHLESDGANGVVAGWAVYGFSQGFLYTQRITGLGMMPWGTNGILVNPLAVQDFNRVGITMTADHSGNYIFGWPVQADGGFNYTGYRAQKINSAGTPQWATTGIDIFTNTNASVYYPYMIYNSNQSVVTAWTDQRNLATNGTDIYGAKIGADGVLVESPPTDLYTMADGNWNDPTIWTSGSVPPSGANVVIQNKIIANVNALCASITLQSSGSLTVNTGIHISILH